MENGMKKFLCGVVVLLLSVNMILLAQEAAETKELSKEEQKKEKKAVRLAKQEIAKTITTVGGPDIFKGVKTLHVKGLRDVVDPGRGMKENFDVWINMEDTTFYAEYFYGNGIWKSCWNGEKAWMENPFNNNGKAMRISRRDQRYIAEMMRYINHPIYQYEKNNLKVRYEDEYELKNGKDYNKIRVTYPDYTQEDFYLDLTNGEVYKRQMLTKNYMNKSVDQELFIDEYQVINGIRFPKKAREVHNGIEMKIVYFDTVEFNVELPLEKFKFPTYEEEAKETEQE